MGDCVHGQVMGYVCDCTWTGYGLCVTVHGQVKGCVRGCMWLGKGLCV